MLTDTFCCLPVVTAYKIVWIFHISLFSKIIIYLFTFVYCVCLLSIYCCHVGDVKCWIISRTCGETSFQSPMSGFNLKLEKKKHTHFTKIIPQLWFIRHEKSGLILVVLPSCEIQLKWEAIKKSPFHCKMKNTSFHKMTRSPQLHQSIHKNNSVFWPFIGCETSFKDCPVICTFSCYDTKHINSAMRDSEPSGGLLSNIQTSNELAVD